MSAVSVAVPSASARSAAPSLPATAGAAATARTPLWRWGVYDLAGWALVALLFAVQAAARSPQPFNRILATQAVSFLPCAIFTPIIALVALRYRFTDGAWLRSAAVHFLCLMAFLVIGSMMMGALEWVLPWVPYGGGMWQAVRHAIMAYFAIDTLIYGLVVTAVLSLAYGRESRVRALRAARLQTQLAEAQLHALGAQLQPHFLFNTLHVISALVRHDPRRAEQLIARLSDLLREMLDNSDRVEVPLRDELAFLEKYVEIQEARFGPRLEVMFEIAPAAMDLEVPRFALQPLVENAIRHGIAPRREHGSVVVSATLATGALVLTVRDNGIGLPTDAPVREGVGLGSTRARLLQLYGPASHLTISSPPSGGTVCTIVIPRDDSSGSTP